MLKSADVTPPPPTSLKPDVNNTSLGLKDKIEKMGSKELEKSEDDEEVLNIEEDQVELRKHEGSDTKRCRVLFRYYFNQIMRK